MADLPGGVLLDTHALIWLVEGGLKPGARAKIADAGFLGRLFVSSVTGWELGLLTGSGTRRSLELKPSAREWFDRVMRQPSVREVSLTATAGFAASFLPGTFHRDPADRLLVATARELGVPIVTRDERILIYAAAGHVQAIPC